MVEKKGARSVQPVQAMGVKPLPLNPMAGVNKHEETELLAVQFKEQVQCGGYDYITGSWKRGLQASGNSARIFYSPLFGGSVKVVNVGHVVYVPLSNVRQFTPMGTTDEVA